MATNSFVLLLFVATAGVSALIPAAGVTHQRGVGSPATATAPRLAARVAPRTSAPPVMVGVAGKVMALPALYALMSANEYVTHRWYQHEEFNRDHALNRFFQHVARIFRGRPLWKPDGRRNVLKIFGGGHVEHHAETYDDMSLKKDPRWRRTKAAASLDSDDFRGTAFTWQTTGLMTIQMLLGGTPLVFGLLGFSLLEMLAVLLPGMVVHALMWNMLHPPMHGLPKVPASVGAPSAWPFGLDDKLRNSWYFKFIYENHQGHHVLGGQANYNVCCPGFDHVLGTYSPPAQWARKMRAVPAADATERWGVPLEPAGVPQAPIISKEKVTARDLTPTALLRKEGGA